MRKLWNNGILECWNTGQKPAVSNSNLPIFQSSNVPARNAGLTLVEVMLAIVILGIGTGILLVAISRCMSVATQAQYYSKAHRFILQVEAEKPITRGEIDEGTESGKFDDGFTWEREITESEDEGREGLYLVRTRVSWSRRGKNAFEEVQSYHYIRPDDDELRERRGY